MYINSNDDTFHAGAHREFFIRARGEGADPEDMYNLYLSLKIVL
jgi:hypothetical protein